MALRNMKLRGATYASSGNVQLNVSFNGSTVHNGDVTTKNEATPTAISYPTDDLVVFDIDSNVSGNVAVSITVTGGDFWLDGIVGNYSTQDPTEDKATRYLDLNTNDMSSDGKNNVQIDGTAMPREPQNDIDASGEWAYLVPNGSTITFDYNISIPYTA